MASRPISFVDEECPESLGQLVAPQWQPLPELREGEVQVFTLKANGDARQREFAESVLSGAERERAARIRVERAREEFILGRAALRVLLGAAARVEPRAVEIQIDRFGKPSALGIHSNVSHSRGLIYVALCRDAPVGVDVEWIDPELEVMELAEANFTAGETALLAAQAPGRTRAATFCKIWTRKEAVAKANGRGLQIPLRSIVLPTDAPGPARIEESDVTEGELPQIRIGYFLQGLDAPEGFAAALAVHASICPIDTQFFLLDLLSSRCILGLARNHT